jgi:hypothetical protein
LLCSGWLLSLLVMSATSEQGNIHESQEADFRGFLRPRPVPSPTMSARASTNGPATTMIQKNLRLRPHILRFGGRSCDGMGTAYAHVSETSFSAWEMASGRSDNVSFSVSWVCLSFVGTTSRPAGIDAKECGNAGICWCLSSRISPESGPWPASDLNMAQ